MNDESKRGGKLAEAIRQIDPELVAEARDAGNTKAVVRGRTRRASGHVWKALAAAAVTVAVIAAGIAAGIILSKRIDREKGSSILNSGTAAPPTEAPATEAPATEPSATEAPATEPPLIIAEEHLLPLIDLDDYFNNIGWTQPVNVDDYARWFEANGFGRVDKYDPIERNVYNPYEYHWKGVLFEKHGDGYFASFLAMDPDPDSNLGRLTLTSNIDGFALPYGISIGEDTLSEFFVRAKIQDVNIDDLIELTAASPGDVYYSAADDSRKRSVDLHVSLYSDTDESPINDIIAIFEVSELLENGEKIKWSVMLGCDKLTRTIGSVTISIGNTELLRTTAGPDSPSTGALEMGSVNGRFYFLHISDTPAVSFWCDPDEDVETSGKPPVTALYADNTDNRIIRELRGKLDRREILKLAPYRYSDDYMVYPEDAPDYYVLLSPAQPDNGSTSADSAQQAQYAYLLEFFESEQYLVLWDLRSGEFYAVALTREEMHSIFNLIGPKNGGKMFDKELNVDTVAQVKISSLPEADSYARTITDRDLIKAITHRITSLKLINADDSISSETGMVWVLEFVMKDGSSFTVYNTGVFLTCNGQHYKTDRTGSELLEEEIWYILEQTR